MACALGLLVLAGCRPELDYVVDSFRSSQATLSGAGETITVLFNSDAGTASLDLSSSGAWKAEFVNGRAYWCTLSQEEGKRGVATLTFTVQANGEYDERSASVVFTNGDLKRTIVVVQKQRDAMLLSSGRVDIDANGGTVTVEVSSNIDFTHSVASEASGWIHSLGTKGLRQSVVSFAIDANEALDRRSGVITFQGPAGEETVTVYQKGEVPTIVVSDEEVSLPAEEGILQVEVASNIDVTFEIQEDDNWLEEIKTRTISTRTFTFAYTRNHGRKERTCNIVFRNEDFAKADTVWIVQPAAEIIRAGFADYVYVPSAGATVRIPTSDAVDDFSLVHLESDWTENVSMEKDPEDGRYFLLKIEPNPNASARQTECHVYRPGFDEADILQIFQFSQKPSFTYETTLREVTAPSFQETIWPILVIWGDGTRDIYEKDLKHSYAESGKHTIRFEGVEFPLFLIDSPLSGGKFDFSNLRYE